MDTKNENLSLPKEPITLDSLITEEFNSIIETGLSQAKSDQSRPVADVFVDLKQKYPLHTNNSKIPPQIPL